MNKAYKKYSAFAFLAVTLSYSTGAQALAENPRWYDGTFDSVTVDFGDLEWLRWDQTLNMSVNEALTTYESEGWRLATNEEMADLLNSYFPVNANTTQYSQYDTTTNTYSTSPQAFSGDENIRQTSWDPATHPGYDAFESDFGLTDFACDPYDFYGCEAHAAALFGSDLDGDGQYNIADISYTYYSDNSYSTVKLDDDRYESDYAADSLADSEFYTFATGVALVKDSVVAAPEINAKGTMIALALLSSLMLVYRERRRGLV